MSILLTMPIKKLSVLGISCFFGLLLSGCQVKESLDKAVDQVDKLGNKLDVSIRDAKQNIALIQGMNSFEKALKKEKISHKILAATSVYQTLPYQSWHHDLKQSREKSIEGSLEIFFSQLNPYLEDGLFYPDKVNIVFDNNIWKTLGVFGVTADSISDVQKNNMSVILYSVNTLIEKALEMKESYEKGESVPSWVPVILRRESESIKLLQFRHVFSTFLFAYYIDPDKLKGVSRTNILSKILFGWEIFSDEISSAKLEKAVEYLEKAEQTRNFLKKIGVEPVWPFVLRRLITKLQFKKKEEEEKSDIFLKLYSSLEVLFQGLKENMSVHNNSFH